jgi:hypothetical protein
MQGCSDTVGESGFLPDPRDMLSPEADAFFDDVASSQGPSRSLNPNELGAALESYAPEGKFTLESYIQLHEDLGLPRDGAVRSYQNLAAQNGGEVTIDTMMEFLSDFAGPSGSWNKGQFAEGFDALAQTGAPSEDQVKTSFDQLSRGNGRLNMNELGQGLSQFARGNVFSPKEFADFGASLGFNETDSRAVFDGLRSEFGRNPTVDDIMSFALESAGESGQWNFDQFADVVSRLGDLSEQYPPMLMGMTFS